MANWLEATTWDAAADDQAPELASAGSPTSGSSTRQGNFLSSSRLEAHRLASAYIMNGKVGGRRPARNGWKTSSAW